VALAAFAPTARASALQLTVNAKRQELEMPMGTSLRIPAFTTRCR
jgi:hypothetical protein